MAITLLGHQPIDFTYKENSPCENLSNMCLQYETADNPMFQIKNTLPGSLFVTIQGTGTTEFAETVLDDNYYTVSGDHYTYTLDFDALGITEGCYVLCVYEAENIVTNGTFNTNLSGWTHDDSWGWSDGGAAYVPESGLDPLEQADLFTIGETYTITFTINNLEESGDSGVRIDSIAGTPEYTESGTYTVTGVAIAVDLIFTPYEDPGGVADFTLDNIAAYSMPDNPIVCSPCINVQETQPECLLLVTAENDSNALNFVWSGLTLKARINAKFSKVEYDEDSEDLDDNGGDHIRTYFDGKKNRNFQIDPAPIFIHDFLFMCKGVDTFKISGVEYVIIDKYPSITWNKGETEGTAELKVRKKNYKLNKTNCG